MKSPMDKAYRVTSPYGMRTLNGKADMHNGIDLVPSDGYHPTAILSPVDGTIADIASNIPDSHTGLGITSNVKGNFVWIQTAAGYMVKFHHLRANSIPANYAKGTVIKADQLIGVMGTTGQSSGVHLHYEFLDPTGKSFDPAPYIGTALQFPNPQASATATGTIKLGDKVRVQSGAKTYTGGGIASFVYSNTYTVDSLSGDRAVLDAKGICTPVNVKDLTLA